MKLKPAFVILTLFFLLQNYCFCQTTQEQWTAGGYFKSDRFIIDKEPTNGFSIQAKLGYVFLDRWLASAQLDAAFIADDFLFRQRLNVRYSFIHKYPVEIYAGVDSELVDQRAENSSGRNIRSVNVLIGPLTGIHHFLNSNTALDMQLRIPIFHYYNSEHGQKGKINGLINANFSLLFFFGNNNPNNITEMSDSLSFKRWMIGGSVLAGQGNIQFLSDVNWLNKLSPYAGFIFNKRIMLGLRFHFLNSRDVDRVSIGLSPFIRYYFSQKKYNHFYLEQFFAISYGEDLSQRYKETGDAYTGTGFGLGWSRYIIPNVRLDLSGGFKWYHIENGISKNIFAGTYNTRIYFQIGLESYL